MKQIFIFIFLVLFSVSIFGQSVTPHPDKDYYLHKSKSQKTVAWVMLGGGVTLMAVGLAAMQSAVIDDNLGGKPSSFGAGDVLFYTGLASSVVSIPMFISAGKNKKKAAEIAIKVNPVLSTQQNFVTVQKQPALSLKVLL